MKIRKFWLLILLTILAGMVLTGCRAKSASVTGFVTYKADVTLPPSGIITVLLLDSSMANTDSELIDQQVIESDGYQSPFPFELKYDPGIIQKGHKYIVVATISANKQLWFRTDTEYPVITNGSNSVEIELEYTR